MGLLAVSNGEFFASWLFRWAHVVFGVTWIGILYYFNFAQTPAFAQMEPAHRNGAFDKLVPRALWYFRYAALATVISGIILYGINQDLTGDSSAWNISILTGMLLGLVMAYNVWMVIWPNQKIVIENARGLLVGNAALPTAGDAGRKGLIASRTNTLFSVSMLMFMTGAGHWFPIHWPALSGGGKAVYWILAVLIIAAIEANALGFIGGIQGPGTKLLEDYKNIYYGSVALAVLFYLIWEIVL